MSINKALCSHSLDFGLNKVNSVESCTCAKFGKHLHGVIESLLAEQVEGVEILDVMYLLLLVSI